MNRKVLIVTPFFAPQSHSAVFRAYKLARHLPSFGWKPFVLTVDTQYQYNEDPGLLNALPPDVQIVPSRYIEPTLRGVRMALGGGDRTFRALKQQLLANQPVSSRNHSRSSALYHHILSHCFSTPDTYWTWARSAIRRGRELIREHDIGIVYSTAPPYSSFVVGRALQRLGPKWVADFRDPLCYTRKLTSEIPRVRERQRAIVREVLDSADAVTIASSAFRSIYSDMFGSLGTEPVFIPTGVDEELARRQSDEEVPSNPYLLFAGEILPDYDLSFWEAVALALGDSELRGSGFRILVVGDVVLNRRRLEPVVGRLGIRDRIEFRDQMPQERLYKLLRSALAGILIPGVQAYWWTNFAKMTDCIGLRKPVVAVVPDPSEARTALTRTHLGIFLDGSAQARARILWEFVLGAVPPPQPDDAECQRYTAKYQVRSMVEIFERLLGIAQSPQSGASTSADVAVPSMAGQGKD